MPTRKGACHERRLVGRNPPPGRDREALRPGHFTTTPLLAAHGGRGAQAGPAPRAPGRRAAPASWTRTGPRSTPCWPSIPNSRRCASARRSLAAPMAIPAAPVVVRRYLRTVRPARGRVYQEVHYEPAQAMQVDWGECGRVQVGATTRKVSVFVAVLCYSRLIYHRVHALAAQGGVLPRNCACPRVLRWQSPRHHLRQLEGGRAQRLGPRQPVSIPSSWRCAATSACSRSPANGATRNQKGSSREACATSSTTPWPDVPRN